MPYLIHAYDLSVVTLLKILSLILVKYHYKHRPLLRVSQTQMILQQKIFLLFENVNCSQYIPQIIHSVSFILSEGYRYQTLRTTLRHRSWSFAKVLQSAKVRLVHFHIHIFILFHQIHLKLSNTEHDLDWIWASRSYFNKTLVRPYSVGYYFLNNFLAYSFLWFSYLLSVLILPANKECGPLSHNTWAEQYFIWRFIRTDFMTCIRTILTFTTNYLFIIFLQVHLH